MSDHRDIEVSANGAPSLKDRVRELQLGDRLDANATSKGGGATWLPWLLCILMAIAWAGAGIRWYRASTTPTGGTGEAAKVQPKTEQADPIFGTGEIVLESKGYLIPSHSISISPIDVAGRVIRIEIEEGKTFKKGDILAEIDSTRFRAIKDESQAQVAAARARLEELQLSTHLEIQQAEYELQEAKAQRDEAKIVWDTARSTLMGAVAKLEIDQTQKKHEAASERVKVLETKLKMVREPKAEDDPNIKLRPSPRLLKIQAAMRDLEASQSRLVQAQWQMDNCTIRARVTGVILTKKAEIGSLINPVVGGVSTNLCDMADLSQIEVDLEIQERDISRIRTDMLCRVRSDAYPTRPYVGYVDRMMPIANRARGIIAVRVRVVVPPWEEQGKFLKPEMGVSVTFINTDADPSIKIAAEKNMEIGPVPRSEKSSESAAKEASK